MEFAASEFNLGGLSQDLEDQLANALDQLRLDDYTNASSDSEGEVSPRPSDVTGYDGPLGMADVDDASSGDATGVMSSLHEAARYMDEEAYFMYAQNVGIDMPLAKSIWQRFKDWRRRRRERAADKKREKQLQRDGESPIPESPDLSSLSLEGHKRGGPVHRTGPLYPRIDSGLLGDVKDSRTDVEKWLDEPVPADDETLAWLKGTDLPVPMAWMASPSPATTTAEDGGLELSGYMGENENLDGIFSWIKKKVFGHELYPAESSTVRGGLPQDVRSGAALDLEPKGAPDELKISVKGVRASTIGVDLQRLRGDDSVLVYDGLASRASFPKSAFFKEGNYLKPAFVEVSFHHPNTGKRVSKTLLAAQSRIQNAGRNLLNSPVWATKSMDGMRLVLRFQGEGQDALLDQFIIVFKIASKFLDGGLTLEEQKLAQLVLTGPALNVDAVVARLDALTPDPNRLAGAREALAMAVSSFGAAFVRVAMPVSVLNARPTLETSHVNTIRAHTDCLNEYMKAIEAQVAGGQVAQRRGELLAKYLQVRLQSDPKLLGEDKVQQVMTGLSQAFKTLHACNVRGTPQAAQSRLEMMLAAGVEVRSNAGAVYSSFLK